MIAPPVAEMNRKRALRVLGELKPFSPVVGRLLATLSADPDSLSLSTISDLIERDTILAGRVLALSKSALYGSGPPIVSIPRAVSRLGLNKIRNTVLALSVNRVWGGAKTPPKWSMLRFNLHSMATAVAADLLAMCVPTAYPEGAFVAGLFHDIGRLIIAVMLQSEYDPLCQAAEGDNSRLRQSEREMLGFDHCELSAEILKHWNLPFAIQSAVEFHECPEMDETPLPSSQFPLSMIVHTADTYAVSHGISLHDGGSSDHPDPLELLGTSEQKANLLPEFKSQFELIRSFMN